VRRLGKKHWSKTLLTRLYLKEGLTIQQIAVQLNVTPNKIQHAMKQLGIEARNAGDYEKDPDIEYARLQKSQRTVALRIKDAPYANEQELRRLYIDLSMSTRAISVHFGVANSTIVRHLKKFNVSIRSYSEAQKLRFEQNHVVLSVEPAGVVDVYNMEVQGTHNFVVEGGIICKNSVLEQGLAISMSKDGVAAQDILSCVTGTTKIAVRDSAEGVCIESIVGTQGYVHAYDLTARKIVVLPYTKVWEVGKRPTYCVMYELGHVSSPEGFCSVYVTGNQLIMLLGGAYQRADALSPGDLLMPSIQCVEVRVVSVEYAGERTVYDMEVPETHNYAAQGLILHNSTRKTSTGTMSRLLEEAEEKNLAVSSFCVWESIEPCTRLCFDDPVYGTCPIEDKCKGRAHEGSGWYSIDDFIQKARTLSKPMFSTEFENNDPSGEQKVYAEHYDEHRHIISWVDGGRFKTFQQVFQLKEIPRNWRRVGGMDFGAHFAYVQFAIEPRYNIWIAELEYYFFGDRLLSRHAKEVLDAQAHALHITVQQAKQRKIFIFSDPSAKQEILEMRVYGLNCVNAMNNLATGVDEVKQKLDVSPVNNLPRLLILDHCIELRREFKAWAHPTKTDGKPDLDAYEDGNDHCFVAGTLIETDRGSVKIEDLKDQDLILTRNGYYPVLKLWKTKNKGVSEVVFNYGPPLVGTPNHPIWVEGRGFQRLDSLSHGDAVGPMKSVVSVTKLSEKHDVYNLTVDGTPEYFANGVLVHNCLDSTRYAIFTFPRMPRAHVKPLTVLGI
jgi:hypothetical protein